MASGPNNQRFTPHYGDHNYNFHYYHQQQQQQQHNNILPRHHRHYHHHHHNNNNNMAAAGGKEPSGTLDYTGPTHSQTLMEELWKLCEEGKLCDVDLVVGEQTFPAHRAVLAASSSYFDAMFSSNMVEGSQRSVTLPSIDPAFFTLVFKFIYTGLGYFLTPEASAPVKLIVMVCLAGKITLTRENVQEVMATAHQLRILELLDVCCNFLLEELHPSNCVGIYRFAEMYSCTNLKVKAKIYVERHFSDIIEEEEFTELPKDLLKGFLKSEGLSIHNEYQLLQAMLRWVLHNVKERTNFLSELLETIRLPIISTRLLDNLANQCSDPEVQKILLSKFEEHKCLMQETQEDQLDVRSKPRIGVQQSLYVVGGYHRKPDGPGHFLNSVECWPFHKGNWQQLPQMKFARRGHGMGVIDGLLYVVGGEMSTTILDSSLHPGGWDGREVDASIERYDPTTDVWTYEGKMKCPRFAMGVAAHETRVPLQGYGGAASVLMLESAAKASASMLGMASNYSQSQTFTKVCLDHGAMINQSCTPTPHSMKGIRNNSNNIWTPFCIADNKIYLAGGLNQHSEPQFRVEAYCPDTQTWEVLAHMNQPRAYFSLAPPPWPALCCGWSLLRPPGPPYCGENNWTLVSSLKHGRAGAGATVYNGSLYVVGGHCHTDRSTVTLIDIYYPETNSWGRNRDFHLAKSRCDATVMIF
ncbi:IPP [Cordylochernes scorpioides]|uniref:Kelch-like protein diablo n=1 Tax=Cordylochernes scorpioides TaxID=51811 RepID=A0ABY6KA43_9ARAC|nr:IPP [Cordylochernes scorpioides]